MSRYEFVKTSLWNDAWFQELPSAEKAAFIFLFTNESIRPSGIYPLTIRTWAFFSGYELTQLQELKTNWISENKVKYDDEFGIIWVVNYLLHNPNKHLPNVKLAISKDMEQYSKCCFFNEFIEAYPWVKEGSPSLTSREGKGREGSLSLNINGSKRMTPIDEFFTRYQNRLHQKPVINGAKDGKLLGDIERQLGREEFNRRLDLFFQSTDEFIIKAGYTVGVFVSQINKVGVTMGRNLSAGEKTHLSTWRPT